MTRLSVPTACRWACLILLTVALTMPELYAQGRRGRRGRGDTGGNERGDSPGAGGRGGGGESFRGGPPGMMPGGGFGGRGGYGGGFGGGPMSFFERMDRNGNGMLDPDEMQGPSRMMIERFAGPAKLDLSRPVPLSEIGRAFEEMRSSRMLEFGGDPRFSSYDRARGGDDRGRDRRDARSSSSDAEYAPLVPGFGEIDLFDPVPGFGDLGERFAVKIEQEDQQEASRTMSRNDANKDGVLDPEEIQRVRWRNNPLQTDRNGDGKLTLNELALRYAVRRVEREGSSAGSRTASRSSSSRGTSSSSDSSGDRRSAMINMFFGRYDRDGNGVIDREEMASMRSGGERYDGNRDGKITREEFAQGMSAMYGGAGRGGDDGRSPWFSRRGGRDNSQSDKDSGNSARTISSSDRKSYRRPTAVEQLADLEGLPDWFTRSDADEDGQVRMSEYATSWSDKIVADFGQFDLNGDGIVTPSECLEAVDRGAVQGAAPATDSRSSDGSRRSSYPPASASGSGPTARTKTTSTEGSSAGSADANLSSKYVKYAVGVIRRYDTNKDTVLTEDEWKSMPKDYSSADTDKDGRLTPTELAKAYASPK